MSVTRKFLNGRLIQSADANVLCCGSCGRWCKLLIDGECWTCAAGLKVPL